MNDTALWIISILAVIAASLVVVATVGRQEVKPLEMLDAPDWPNEDDYPLPDLTPSPMRNVIRGEVLEALRHERERAEHINDALTPEELTAGWDKALSDPDRIAILEALLVSSDRPLRHIEIENRMSNRKFYSHTAVLRKAGLLVSQNPTVNMVYSLNEDHVERLAELLLVADKAVA